MRLAPRTLTIAAWSLAVVALAAFCLWPIASNPGFFGNDELELWSALRRGQGVFAFDWFTQTDQLFYRPLGFSLFAVQLRLADGTAPAAHLWSLLHHGINGGLACLVFARLQRPWWSALPFLLLPTVLGAVGWVAATYDRLLVTLLLGATWALLQPGRRALWSLPLFALALATKETAVAFPLLIWLLGWPRTRLARIVAIAITVGAVGFAVSRLTHGSADGSYALRVGPDALVRLLRYVAFPFSLSADAPGSVWGQRWIDGSCGIGLLTAIALWRQPRAALGGLVAYVVPLLPVLALGKLEGQYLYASSLGLAWLAGTATLGRDPMASSLRGLVAALGALALLLAPLVIHSHRVAVAIGDVGMAMHNLQVAHRTLPAAAEPIDLVAAPGAPTAAALRFILYLEHTGTLPPLRLVTDGRATSAPTTGLLVTAAGVVQRR